MRPITYALFFVVSMSSFLVAMPVLAANTTNCTQFGRNLSQGMSGEDVRALQRALNADAATRVAESGPGAPGAETAFFGSLTRAAAVRFQEIHAKDILAPIGLSKGTGFVGAATRAFLGRACGATVTPTSTPVRPPASSSASSPVFDLATIRAISREKAEKAQASEISTKMTKTLPDMLGGGSIFARSTSTRPFITMPSPYAASPGDRIRVGGGNFDLTGNLVRIGATTVSDVAANTRRDALVFTLPLSTPYGTHPLGVSTKSGSTLTGPSLIVRPKGTSDPALVALVPISGKSGDVIVISGSGFTPSGNTVRVADKSVVVGSANGTALSLTLPGGLFGGMRMGTSTTVRVTVTNENGVSNALPFTVVY